MKIVRYSEAFKLRVVKAIEEGEVENFSQAQRKFGILGSGTIRYWVRKYGKNHLLGKVIRVENAKERDQLKELKTRIRDLERTLADTTVDLAIERAYTEMLAEQAGVEDLGAFKKKADAKRH